MKRSYSYLFFKDSLKLSLAPISIQVINLLTLPIITRLFSPEMFGEFSLFFAILGPVSTIICLGYEPSIVQAKKNNDAISLLIFCVFTSALFSIISFLFIYVFKNSLLEKIDNLEFHGIIYLIPIWLFLGGFFQALRYYNLRNKNFVTISLSNMLSVLFDKLFIIILGLSGYVTSLVLILGNILDAITKPIIHLIKLKSEFQKIIKNFSIKRIKENVVFYKNYFYFILPNSLFSRLVIDLPFILIVFFFSELTLGLYVLSFKLLNMPVKLIGNSIGDVFYQRESKNKIISKENVLNTFNYLLFSSLPFILLLFYSEEIFEIIFGNEWIIAGYYSKILIFFVFMRFITIISHYIFMITNKQKYILILTVLTFISSVFAFSIGGYFESFILSLFLISFINGFIHLIFNLISFKIIGINYLKIIKVVIKHLIYLLPFTLSIYLLKNSFVFPISFTISILLIVSILILIFKKNSINFLKL